VAVAAMTIRKTASSLKKMRFFKFPLLYLGSPAITTSCHPERSEGPMYCRARWMMSAAEHVF
jgi:hypothetical protein